MHSVGCPIQVSGSAIHDVPKSWHCHLHHSQSVSLLCEWLHWLLAPALLDAEASKAGTSSTEAQFRNFCATQPNVQDIPNLSQLILEPDAVPTDSCSPGFFVSWATLSSALLMQSQLDFPEDNVL